jgi:hypothetical protein
MKLCYYHYRKLLNHYLYIPWSSLNTKYIKKSILGGELARLAINRSHCKDYCQAAQEFRNVLRLHSWPMQVLHPQFKELLEK